jgi:hypothetical protein
MGDDLGGFAQSVERQPAKPSPNGQQNRHHGIRACQRKETGQRYEADYSCNALCQGRGAIATTTAQ